jgi:hypothetical protein
LDFNSYLCYDGIDEILWGTHLITI